MAKPVVALELIASANSSSVKTDSSNEKKTPVVSIHEDETGETEAVKYGVMESELQEMKRLADGYSMEETTKMVDQMIKIHKHDPNFDEGVLEMLLRFVEDPEVRANPEGHQDFIRAVKLEAALSTINSPYASVRAVIDATDDVNIPCSTLRAWGIGIVFTIFIGFINQLFSIRQPAIFIGGNVAQLLAYPAGRAAARWLPDKGFTLGGQRISLNPGPFSKKEHMIITIMASVGAGGPYSGAIVLTQFLPSFFNQAYAGSFYYQILIGIGTNFVGYGLAGLCRSFLVYPAYCVWPQSLVVIATNSAFHEDDSRPVRAPSLFGRGVTWLNMSKYRFFVIGFLVSFAYFWIPNYFFLALSMFSWMSWIAPNNVVLNSVVGWNNGVGLNPVPTLDWNNILHGGADPLMMPMFATMNKFAGNFLSLFVVLALWYTNAYHTAYLPLNTNRLYDNKGKLYNVTRSVNGDGLFDAEAYENYSQPWMAAGNVTHYIFHFALYTSIFTWALVSQRHEIKLGFVQLYRSFFFGRRSSTRDGVDVHNRLMSKYKEVPGWWFFFVLVVSIGCGVAGVVFWPTNTSPAVIFWGLLLCVVFIVPVGVVKAMTGVEVNLAILAEFIGGGLVPGNALALMYMKAYGMVTCAHALGFANDFKIAHYVKIPQRTTFAVQMVATLISTFVCTGVLNFQMRYIPNVCTVDAPWRLTCPWVTGFMSSAVLWGTIGPVKLFGKGGMYSLTLLGFPFGAALTLVFWWAKHSRWIKARSHYSRWLRQVHPVVALSGAVQWAPFNVGYIWPAVPVAWLSWGWCRSRFPAFWGRYNFVLSGSLGTGIAVAGLVIFFAVQLPGLTLNWWGNSIVYAGCEAQTSPCRLKTLAEGEYFGPRRGEWH